MAYTLDITFNDYITPTQRNWGSDACRSVGIMNLTKDEVEVLRFTVSALRRDRAAAKRPGQSVLADVLIAPWDNFAIGKGFVGPVGVSGQQGIDATWPRKEGNDSYWSQRSNEFAQEVAKLGEPDEPEEKRNRFSGLDLD